MDADSRAVRLGDVPQTTLAELLERYDVLLIDAFGVLVDGRGAIPGSADALRAIDEAGRRLLVVTNDASRLPERCAEGYAERGLPLIPAEDIVTSGAVLAAHFERKKLSGARCIVLGTPDSRAYVEAAGGLPVELDDDADADALIVCDEDGFPLLEGLNAALTVLFRHIDRGDPVELLLPNPDMLFPRGWDRFGITAGAIGAMIEAALANRYPGREDLTFERLGKPHAPIFEEALRRGGDGRVVMIGDQLQTDVLGAARAGIDTVIVGTGLTPWDLDLELTEARPTWRMAALGTGLPAPRAEQGGRSEEERVAEMIAYYTARAPEYDEWFLRRGRYDYGPEHTARWWAEVDEVRTALVRQAPLGRVLELACGTGWWTEQLADDAESITAVDASAEMIRQNRERLRSGDVSYVHGDVYEWQPAGPHDTIFFSFWLSHVPPARFDEFWERLARWLAPGGKVFFVDSLASSSGTARDQYVDQDDVIQTRRLNDGRAFEVIKIYYEPAELRQRLEALGWRFEIRATRRFFLYGAGELA